MRTIKFRGKRLDDPQQWEYGYYQQDETDAWMHTLDGRVLRIIPNTLGQFTDLHDKQGNEIYQGDILRWATLVGVVTWHPYGYWCIHTGDDDISNHTYITIGEAIEIAKNENYDFKVIGNIHDNPDLQKGGQP